MASSDSERDEAEHFMGLRRDVPDISQRMLTQMLRQFGLE